MKGHDIVEKNIGLMLVLIVVAINFGSLVEIVPQFFLKQTTTPIEGLKYLKPRLEGHDGLLFAKVATCVIRKWCIPLRAEVERYSHYSVAGESVYVPHSYGVQNVRGLI